MLALSWNLASVRVRTRTLVNVCEVRETLTQAYLDATEANRKASESVGDMHAPEWLEATKETRLACETALAALKLHIREHEC